MKSLTWLSLAVLLAMYAVAVAIFGFPGVIALGIHFIRLTVTIAALVIYIQMAPTIFEEVPPPRRDYLIAGINFLLLSAVGFSFWNEAGRLFGVSTSILSSPVAGVFSLFLIVGAIFSLAAPTMGNKRPRIIALLIGAVLSVGLVFIAPLFR